MKKSILVAVLLLSMLSSSAIAAKNFENESNWSAVRACAENQQMAHLDTIYKDTLAFVGRDNGKAAVLLRDAQTA
jgi:hypothetical protein